jgi:hypothetical protein
MWRWTSRAHDTGEDLLGLRAAWRAIAAADFAADDGRTNRALRSPVCGVDAGGVPQELLHASRAATPSDTAPVVLADAGVEKPGAGEQAVDILRPML